MSNEWEAIGGIVVKGHRLASGIDGNSPFGRGTIELQAQIFRERGLDLTHCFHGTLNVSIKPWVFEMKAQEPTFRNVKWHENYGPENFFFSACRVIFRGNMYEGWVYYPDPRTKEAHQHDPSCLEIIAPRVPDIAYCDAVIVQVNPQEILISQ